MIEVRNLSNLDQQKNVSFITYLLMSYELNYLLVNFLSLAEHILKWYICWLKLDSNWLLLVLSFSTILYHLVWNNMPLHSLIFCTYFSKQSSFQWLLFLNENLDLYGGHAVHWFASWLFGFLTVNWIILLTSILQINVYLVQFFGDIIITNLLHLLTWSGLTNPSVTHALWFKVCAAWTDLAFSVSLLIVLSLLFYTLFYFFCLMSYKHQSYWAILPEPKHTSTIYVSCYIGVTLASVAWSLCLIWYGMLLFLDSIWPIFNSPERSPRTRPIYSASRWEEDSGSRKARSTMLPSKAGNASPTTCYHKSWSRYRTFGR